MKQTKTHGQKVRDGRREGREGREETRYPPSPESAAHRGRLEAMVPDYLLEHPRIKDLLQRQIVVILSDLQRNGFHRRSPKADLELMDAIQLAKREPYTAEPDDA